MIFLKSLKKPCTFSEQVAVIKKHNLIIEDEEEVRAFFSKNNYYRFTGYALQFRVSPNSSDYQDGVEFKKIKRIYEFDERLRNLVMSYLGKTEVLFRTVISNTFSLLHCNKEPYDQHYNSDNYGLKAGFEKLKIAFSEHRHEYYGDMLMTRHHAKKYGDKMPLWVIAELMSFSDLSRLYSFMFSSDQNAISSKFGVSSDMLQNNMHCLVVLRNKCAHLSRLYNSVINPSVQFSQEFLRKNPELNNGSLYAHLLNLRNRQPTTQDKRRMAQDLINLVKEYIDCLDLKLMGFPLNWESMPC